MSFTRLGADHTAAPGSHWTDTALRRPAPLAFVVALLARLVALPFATLDSGDSVSRVFLGWQWLEHPHFITNGVWGPLHFYLIAAMLEIWPDPVWAPIVLHLVLGALTSVVIYKLSLELFGSSRAALLAALAWAVYPMAILISLEAHPETPFLLCLAVALLYLARARRPGARVSLAAAAGVGVGLASMIRYEAWMLMPFLALLLLPRWQLLAAFLGVAMLHPIAWMAGNMIAHGDPLYGVDWASNWELNVMGHRQLQGFSFAAMRVWQLLEATARGLTLPLSALIALGAIGCLRRREQSLWLLPPLALFLLLAAAAARGSIWVKPAYTSTFGLMVMPFVAGFFASQGVEEWTGRKFAAAAIALLALISVFTIEPLWRIVPHTRWLYSEAAGQFQEQRQAKEINALIDREHVSAQDALISDFFGWQPTGYVSLQTKMRPGNMCIASGATNMSVDIAAVNAFLLQHRQGILITREGGKLTSLLRAQPDGTTSLAGVRLKMSPVGTVNWPGTEASPEVGPGLLGVARYSVVDTPGPAASAGPFCDMSCPLSFCTM